MSATIERVARAICRSRGINPDTDDYAPSADIIKSPFVGKASVARPVTFKAWRRFEVDARAAVAEMDAILAETIT